MTVQQTNIQQGQQGLMWVVGLLVQVSIHAALVLEQLTPTRSVAPGRSLALPTTTQLQAV